MDFLGLISVLLQVYVYLLFYKFHYKNDDYESVGDWHTKVIWGLLVWVVWV